MPRHPITVLYGCFLIYVTVLFGNINIYGSREYALGVEEQGAALDHGFYTWLDCVVEHLGPVQNYFHRLAKVEQRFIQEQCDVSGVCSGIVFGKQHIDVAPFVRCRVCDIFHVYCHCVILYFDIVACAFVLIEARCFVYPYIIEPFAMTSVHVEILPMEIFWMGVAAELCQPRRCGCIVNSMAISKAGWR